ncbi:MAG: hypothetical protein HUK00_03010 [Bacteroidaceae bacterium]|nr:hypothetical protein [Bacteroidaceae bacterium]
MKQKVLYFLAIIASLTATSCKDDNTVIGGGGEPIGDNALRVSVCQTETRTEYEKSADGKTLYVRWAQDDSIRVIADADASNPDPNRRAAYDLKFVLKPGGEHTANGTFIKEESAAQQDIYFNSRVQNRIYYPYEGTYDHMTVSSFLNGKVQVQKRNGSDANFSFQDDLQLSKLDFLAATTSGGGDVEVQFQHQISMFRLTLPIPSTATSTAKIQRVVVTGSPYDTDSYILQFDKASQFTVSQASNSVVAFVAVPPATFNIGDRLDVMLVMDNSTTYNYRHTFAGPKTYAAGSIYNCSFNVGDAKEEKFIDFALPSGTVWAECNLGGTSSTDRGTYFMWGETVPHNNNDALTQDSCTLLSVSHAELTDPNGPYRFRTITYNVDGIGRPNPTNPSDDRTTKGGTQTRPDYQGIVRKVTFYRTYTKATGLTAQTYNDSKKWGLYLKKTSDNPLTFQRATKSEIKNYYNSIQWYTVRITLTDRTTADSSTVSVGPETRIIGDAATYHFGSSWHMPTVVQMAELATYCTGFSSRTTKNGVTGYLLKANVTKLQEYYQNHPNPDLQLDWTAIGSKEMFWPCSYAWEGEDFENTWKPTGTSWADKNFRYSTTTAAFGDDNCSNGATENPELGYCWELHMKWPDQPDLHTHHPRSTAISIRPVSVVR